MPLIEFEHENLEVHYEKMFNKLAESLKGE